MIRAEQKLGGGLSILYDAVAILARKVSEQILAKHPAARDFISDAFTHLKFIAYTDAAKPLFEKSGIMSDLDEGCVSLNDASAISKFVKQCAALRFWKRESVVKM